MNATHPRPRRPPEDHFLWIAPDGEVHKIHEPKEPPHINRHWQDICWQDIAALTICGLSLTLLCLALWWVI